MSIKLTKPAINLRAELIRARKQSPDFEHSYADMYISTPVETTVTTLDVAVLIDGVTASQFSSYDFTVSTSNRITYMGDNTKIFEIESSMTASVAGTNVIFSFFVFKNGVKESISEQQIKSSSGDTGSASLNYMLELSTDDYIEFFMSNTTNTTNATVDFMNATVISVN